MHCSMHGTTPYGAIHAEAHSVMISLPGGKGAAVKASRATDEATDRGLAIHAL